MVFDGKIDINDLDHLTIKKVVIRNVKNIPDGIFANKGIEEVVLEEGVLSIGDFAFSSNNISKITFPSSLKNIGCYAFSKNNISNICFNDGLFYIQDKAFSSNKIKEVCLPSSLKKIGIFVFPNDCQVKCFNKVFDISVINQFDDFIDSYKKIIAYVPDFDINKVNLNVLLLLCEDNNLSKLKNYWYNKNSFESLYDELKSYCGIINVRDLFKFCYILGFFCVSKDKEKSLSEFIKVFYLENCYEDYFSIIYELPKMEYYPGLSILFQRYYKDAAFKSIFMRYYNDYNDINKIIRVRKKEKIRLECKKRKVLMDNGESISFVNLCIKKLRDSLGCVSYDDLIEHFNNVFDTKYPLLKSIIPILLGYMTKDEFKRVEDVYARSNSSSVFSNIYLNCDEFGYEWLDGRDVRLFILGYLTDCCFRINGAGEDILIQSMVNPFIKTMVIYYMGKIIGKTTAYYNRFDKYLLFNNIEISNQFMYDLNTGRKEKMNALKIIINGIRMQVLEMEKNGYSVRNVRIGMDHNDLSEELTELYRIENYNLFENYCYDGYDGDANSKNGQAVIVLRNGKYVR